MSNLFDKNTQKNILNNLVVMQNVHRFVCDHRIKAKKNFNVIQSLNEGKKNKILL
jgi:hypothetical protein